MAETVLPTTLTTSIISVGATTTIGGRDVTRAPDNAGGKAVFYAPAGAAGAPPTVNGNLTYSAPSLLIGEQLVITGTNGADFTGTTSVTINGVAQVFVVDNSTQITIAAIAQGTTSGPTVVTGTNGVTTSDTDLSISALNLLYQLEDETATLGNDLTNVGSVPFTSGITENAATFSGNGAQGLQVATSPSVEFGNTDWFVSCRINIAATFSGTVRIISKDDPAAGEREFYLALINNQIFVNVGEGNTTTTESYIPATAPSFTAGVNHHILVTHDAATKTIETFVDGASVGTLTYTITLGVSSLDFSIGRRALSAGGGDQGWNGQIDQVLKGGFVPNSAQIAALYNNGNGVFNPLPIFDAALDADSAIFQAMLRGTYSAAELTAIDTFFVNLKAASIYSKLDRLGLLMLDTEGDSSVDLVTKSEVITPVASPPFTSRVGWSFDGTTQYLRTGFVPRTAGGNFAINDASAGVWVAPTSGTHPVIASAGEDGATQQYTVVFPVSGDLQMRGACSTSGFSSVSFGIQGTVETLYSMVRFNSTGIEASAGTANLAQVTSPGLTTLSDQEFELGHAIFPANEVFSPDVARAYFIGAALSGAERTTLFNEFSTLLAVF